MILDWLRRLAGISAEVLERPVESFIDLETSDEPYDEHAFATRNRSLVTVLRVRGTRDLKSVEDRRQDIVALVRELKPVMVDEGYGVDVHYCRDPDRGDDAVAEQMRAARAAAVSVGLDMRAIHDAQEQFLAERTCVETCHLALWTSPLVLSPVERKEAIASALEKRSGWAFKRARDAQDPFRGLTSLRNRHAGFVSGWKAALGGVGVEVDVLDVHEAGRDIYESLWPGEKAGGFRLVLPGDPVPMMVPLYIEDDPSAILWPTVARQLTAGAWSVDRDGWEVARFGSRLVASVDVTIGPQTPQDFTQLRDRLARAGGGGVPFRMSMKMRSGGARQRGLAAALAPFVALFGGVNGKIMKALDRVRERASEDGCVTWQMSFATWVAVDRLEARKVLRMRMAELRRCVEQWGTMQARTMCGDPVQGALSSVLGISQESTAVQGYAPLAEVLTMLPRRAASPWRFGAVPCLTPDGALYPIEEGSAEVPYCFEIVIAVMRSGKSAWLARKVFGNILASGTDRLPFVFFPDVGFGSQGIIETLKEALPPKMRHLVAHAKMRNDADHAINILDTPLGCRQPPADHLDMIQEAFVALALPAETKQAPEGLSDLILRLINDAYRLRDDTHHNGDPFPYQAGRDSAVDTAIAQAGIVTRLPNGVPMPMWRIVDRLFEAGFVTEARRAQRYAVPVAEDIERLLSDDSILKDFGEHAQGRLINIATIGLRTALEKFKFCKGPTRFEPSAREVALDLQDVIGKGDSDAARKQTAVVYTWTTVAFTRNWWMEPRDVAANRTIPPMYREYHLRIAEDVAATPKILVADEFHETGGSPATREAIKKMARKGPKYRIRILLASHVLRDFDEDMRELASSVTVISATTDKFKNDLCELFGLEQAHRDALGMLGKRDPKLGVPVFSITNTKRGRYSQLIYNAMSPVELWAVATNPQEVQLRRKLTATVNSFSRAVMLLAAFEPFRQHGAEREIELRIARAVEQGDVDAADEAKVIDGIVAELVAIDRNRSRVSLDRSSGRAA